MFEKRTDMQPHKTLTKAEEQIMQAIWSLEQAFLRDIMDILPEPKPHQNTVATILKILNVFLPFLLPLPTQICKSHRMQAYSLE